MTIVQQLIQTSQARNKWIHALNGSTAKFGLKQEFSLDDFLFGPEIVLESDGAFSGAITSLMWPRQSGVFYHYTHHLAAESILTSQKLRLYWVKKRISEDEIRTFLESFGYAYPLEIDPATGAPRFADSLASRLFYMSLTSAALTDKEEQYFWDTFAGADGARLTIQIDSEAAGLLRPMAYGDRLTKLAELLRDINAATTALLGKRFHWDHAPVVCALHLPDCYHVEKETRFIVPPGWNVPIEDDGPNRFVTAPLGRHPILPVTTRILAVESRSALPSIAGATFSKRV